MSTEELVGQFGTQIKRLRAFTCLFVVSLVVVFAGCATPSQEESAPTPFPSASPTEIQQRPTTSPSTPSSALTPLTKEAVASCPVTLPDEATVPDELAYYGNYGNSDLVVTLGRGGKFVVSPNYVAEDGSIGWKFGVYRRTPGKVTVTGRRLDASAPPATGNYDIEGYGESGFQSGGIDFPSEGCWEITIQVGEATPLTVVILMARVAFDPHSQLRIRWLPEGMQRVDTDISNLPQSIGNIYGFTNGDEGTINNRRDYSGGQREPRSLSQICPTASHSFRVIWRLCARYLG